MAGTPFHSFHLPNHPGVFPNFSFRLLANFFPPLESPPVREVGFVVFPLSAQGELDALELRPPFSLFPLEKFLWQIVSLLLGLPFSAACQHFSFKHLSILARASRRKHNPTPKSLSPHVPPSGRISRLLTLPSSSSDRLNFPPCFLMDRPLSHVIRRPKPINFPLQ